MNLILDYRWQTALLIREDQLRPARRPPIRRRRHRSWSPAWLPRRWRQATGV